LDGGFFFLGRPVGKSIPSIRHLYQGVSSVRRVGAAGEFAALFSKILVFLCAQHVVPIFYDEAQPLQ
jgi:hypothetical protein